MFNFSINFLLRPPHRVRHNMPRERCPSSSIYAPCSRETLFRWAAPTISNNTIYDVLWGWNFIAISFGLYQLNHEISRQRGAATLYITLLYTFTCRCSHQSTRAYYSPNRTKIYAMKTEQPRAQLYIPTIFYNNNKLSASPRIKYRWNGFSL